MARPSVTAPIPSARNLSQLIDLIEATVDLVKAAGDLDGAPVDLVEAPVDLVEAPVDLTEAAPEKFGELLILGGGHGP